MDEAASGGGPDGALQHEFTALAFVVYDNRIHIFSKKRGSDELNRLEELNFGIMFANMMVVAEELWLDVDLIRLDNISQKSFPNNNSVLSAILKP